MPQIICVCITLSLTLINFLWFRILFLIAGCAFVLLIIWGSWSLTQWNPHPSPYLLILCFHSSSGCGKLYYSLSSLPTDINYLLLKFSNDLLTGMPSSHRSLSCYTLCTALSTVFKDHGFAYGLLFTRKLNYSPWNKKFKLFNLTTMLLHLPLMIQVHTSHWDGEE